MTLRKASAALLQGCGTASASVINGGCDAGTGTDADNWNEVEIFGGALGATASAARSTEIQQLSAVAGVALPGVELRRR